MSHNTHPALPNRRGSLILGVGAGAATLALLLTGCNNKGWQPSANEQSSSPTSSPSPTQTTTVATCSPKVAGEQVLPAKGYGLTEFQTSYDVVLKSATGKQLRAVSLLVTDPRGTSTATPKTEEVYPDVYTEYDDIPSMEGYANTVDGNGYNESVVWEGAVKLVTKTTIDGTTVDSEQYNESFITSLTCPSADSLLYQPDGTSTTQISN